MYIIKAIKIEDFWHNYQIDMPFNNEVNILIGKNGSGKTTFMNLLQAILTIDIDKLAEVTFSKVEILLIKGNSKKNIKITKFEEFSTIPTVRYKISNKKSIDLPIITSESLRSYPLSMRRKMKDSYDKLKSEFQEIVAVSSLSVYRNNYEYDFDHREYSKSNKYSFSPVDDRLTNLLELLTRYQLELSSKARNISAQLQKSVLLSLLETTSIKFTIRSIIEFNANEQKEKLIDAYKKLGLNSKDVTSKITQHIQSMEKLKDHFKNRKSSNETVATNIDFSPLEIQKRTNNIIQLSLEAEKDIQEIFEPLELYLGELKKFMQKEFKFSSAGDLEIAEKYSIEKLSSGEKQLLILLTEALLQQKKSFIFLADEPELSLHIAWQREILPAVKKINPNAQIIVATHSPEIAGGYRNNIISMKSILSEPNKNKD